MMKRVAFVLLAALAAWVALRRGDSTTSTDFAVSFGSGTDAATTPAAAPPVSPSAGLPPPATSSVGFRSRARLEEHYQKHGAEFGKITIEEYLHRAQALRDATVGGDVLEVVRPTDGVVSRFDRASGAFLAFDADGTVRTFFKPNDGEAYFRRQANRRPSQ